MQKSKSRSLKTLINLWMGLWTFGSLFYEARFYLQALEFHNQCKSICICGNPFALSNPTCFFSFESITQAIWLLLCPLDTFSRAASLRLPFHSLMHIELLHFRDLKDWLGIFWQLRRFWTWEFLLEWHFPKRRLFWPFHWCFEVQLQRNYSCTWDEEKLYKLCVST